MSLYDRGYYHDDDPARGHVRGPKTAVGILIAINVAIFVLDLFTERTPTGGHWLSDTLALDADLFQKPWKAWQLLTAGFAHAPMDSPRYMHIFGNMFALFVFGRPLEACYGKQEFIRLYLTLLVCSLLIWVGIEYLTTGGDSPRKALGASGAISGLIVIFALRFPHEKMVLIPFPAAIPAWVVGLMVVSFDLFGALGSGRGGVAYTAHLGGAALGAAYFFSGIQLGNVFPFTLASGGLPRGGSRLKIHRPNNDDKLAKQADAILKKLHEHGEASITRKERRILNEYSRRVRESAPK